MNGQVCTFVTADRTYGGNTNPRRASIAIGIISPMMRNIGRGPDNIGLPSLSCRLDGCGCVTAVDEPAYIYMLI